LFAARAVLSWGVVKSKPYMRKIVHLVRRARLQISDEWSLGALCGQFVRVSLRYDSQLPENTTEDRSKVTCRSCLRLVPVPSLYDRAELQGKVSDAPDFGQNWAEREAIAEQTANLDFGCDFKGNTCRAMRQNRRGCCCQSCKSRHGFLGKINPSAFNEILALFDRVWGFWRPGSGCILPRKWQSPTCLFFACLPFMKEKDRHDLVQIAEIAGNPKSITDALAVTLMDAEIHTPKQQVGSGG
jgi:hypothetical protein